MITSRRNAYNLAKAAYAATVRTLKEQDAAARCAFAVPTARCPASHDKKICALQEFAGVSSGGNSKNR